MRRCSVPWLLRDGVEGNLDRIGSAMRMYLRYVPT